ncbi:hypothetical protein E2C01_065464 [Portunus trituberculatus]|uniref:Uncharacterized protein n=1 Tax=Portunus trituberculatus TaxID=210409 RepID=A0A5B7HLZ0_PORTR|nr:hypothetical protein [Portunus trituberculatus]
MVSNASCCVRALHWSKVNLASKARCSRERHLRRGCCVAACVECHHVRLQGGDGLLLVTDGLPHLLKQRLEAVKNQWCLGLGRQARGPAR